jgi:hypothetical protein
MSCFFAAQEILDVCGVLLVNAHEVPFPITQVVFLL